MYINVRTIDGTRDVVVTVSKTNTVQELKAKIVSALGVAVDRQRLFYRGKQLVDDHTLFDYKINLNDVVQLMIKAEIRIFESTSGGKKSSACTDPGTNLRNEDVSEVTSEDNFSKSECENNSDSGNSSGISRNEDIKSRYFSVGDLVDVLDTTSGTYLEGKIMSINVRNNQNTISNMYMDDGLIYKVLSDSNKVIEEILNNIRPRAKCLINYLDLRVGETVLANYNMDKPNERGHWYECTVSDIETDSKAAKAVYVNIYHEKRLLIENAKLKFCNEIFKLEERLSLSETGERINQEPIAKRKSAPMCSTCGDMPNMKCKECGCHVCGLKNEPEKQVLCDECDMAYHLHCLDPPLEEVPPEDEWYCPLCKNDENEIVKPGEKLKASKKKEKMASSANTSSRDWGKGMACVGRTKECTLVPSNHYGPIPGVEVGTCWKFRVQVSEAGVHRPHVAGIHGRETDGAYSIVLSGGYEDDVDNGESFLYTGSGGRDLSGNKRTAEQSCNQTLTRMNKALALNCNAPLSDKGAKAEDWRNGKPIRVVRNYKGAKHSKYAPHDGNRYDGLYKVVEYYSQRGKSGFIVWRFVLNRDDATPAPWTKAGKARIQQLGLKMLYPEGFLEAEAAKIKCKQPHTQNGTKRPLKTKQLTLFDTKKLKIDFSLDAEILKAIGEDSDNESLWKLCQDVVEEGKQKFLGFVADTFMCICCQELVHEPVSTKCKHNFCLLCLKRSFKAEVYSCPTCRCDLGQDFKMEVNNSLFQCLLKLFPGYSAGR